MIKPEIKKTLERFLKSADVESFVKLMAKYGKDEDFFDATLDFLKSNKDWDIGKDIETFQVKITLITSFATGAKYPEAIVNFSNENSKTSQLKPCLEFGTDRKMTLQNYYKSNPFGFVFMEKYNQDNAICLSIADLVAIKTSAEIYPCNAISNLTRLVKIANDRVNWYFFENNLNNILNTSENGVVFLIPIFYMDVESALERCTNVLIYGLELVRTNFTPNSFLYNSNNTFENALKKNISKGQVELISKKSKVLNMPNVPEIVVQTKYNIKNNLGRVKTITDTKYLPKSFIKQYAPKTSIEGMPKSQFFNLNDLDDAYVAEYIRE